jgi:Diadenosine tetraphosphate (Ap4A) hydrolase and other HIT family hydrolases
MEKALDVKGIVLMQLSGAAAGQTVPHVHFHLIPTSVHELGKHAAQMGDMEKIKAIGRKNQSSTLSPIEFKVMINGASAPFFYV